MSDTRKFPPHAIAIVGLSGRFPGAADLNAFWRNIAAGVEALQEFGENDRDAAGVPAELWRQNNYVRRGTVLEDAEQFDAGFFGLSPREAQILDPQQRIFLECAWEALENAGYAPGTIDSPVGVYGGAGMNTYLLTQILRDPALVAAVGGYQLMLGNDKDFLCTRVSYKLDLHGPSMTIQTACSTSLVAVQVACRALERRECDMALAGGVSVSFPQQAGYLYQEGMILSPDGHCRPFDVAAGGTRPGAGCGIVVLKRLADAVAAGDTIHAVIRGAAINNDGSGKAGYTAPSVDGQVEAVATAQLLADVEPRSISYLEAHGTATPLGDPIEIAALTQVFRAGTADVGFCRLGSLKANLGHLDAAAGVAGLIKTVLALQRQEFPPLTNFTAPNPQLGLPGSPFIASAQGAPWPTGPTPRRAGVSSFGIGGTNAHVVLEEAPPAPVHNEVDAAQLLVVSARSAAALDAASARLAQHLQSEPGRSLADVAFTLQVGRRAFSHRRVLVASDVSEAVRGLRGGAQPNVKTAQHEGGARPVAFLFTGQGSQFAGMGADLYDSEPVYRATIDRCAEVLRGPLGLDLRDVLFAPADDARVNDTRLAQPALFATEIALARLWQAWGVEPAAMLGHSIGEYVAAHLAGVMSLEDALGLVADRGRLMQQMPSGAMAAVHLAADDLAGRLARFGGAVEIAAINAPQLCTIAGPHDALNDALAMLASAGVETKALRTSHAFHSAMMAPAMAPFAARVAQMKLAAPSLRFVSNVTGTWITAEQATSPAYWAEHLRRAVRFEAGVRTLAADAALHLLEVGPGQTLATLARMGLGKDGARRVTATLEVPRTATLRAAGQEKRALLDAAGRLWLAGVPLDWRALHAPRRPRRVPLPSYPFERKRCWVEAKAVAAAPLEAPEAVAHSQVGSRLVPSDGLFAPTWARDDALDPNVGGERRLSGTWLVVAQPGPLGTAVQVAVERAGARALRVEEGEAYAIAPDGSARLRPGVLADVLALTSELRRTGSPLRGVLYLWSLTDASASPARRLQMLYHALVAFGCGVDASPAAPVRLVVATAGAQAVLDEFNLRPGAAAALGPVLVLPQEVPGLEARVVDLDARPDGFDVSSAAARLVAEAATADDEPLIAWRNGRRWARRFERCSLPRPTPAELPIAEGSVVLITGGLGGMGLALARHLAQSRRARLLLTARSNLPPREAWDAWLAAHGADDRHSQAIATLRAIEAAGGEVLTAAADCADAAAMAAAIQTARARWGRIDVLIHAAGIPGNGQLAVRKLDSEIDAVMSPKSGGLQVLCDQLGDTPLACVVLMSSFNTVLGVAGVVEYAAANALLDSFVESDQVPAAWRRVLVLDWGPWSEVGMAARLEVPAAHRTAWQAYLQTTIGTAEALDVFERAVASGRRRLVVLPFDLNHVLTQRRAGARREAQPAVVAAATQLQTPAPAPAPAPAAREAVVSSNAPDFESPVGETEVRLAAIWTELLGVERIGAQDDFFALGGHSLLATRVLARIGEAHGVRLALRDVFDAPTLRALAQRIAAVDSPDEEREEIEF